MSTTQRDVDRLRNTPCPKLSMTGLDGSVIHRKTWLEYVLDDHGRIKKLNRSEAQQWGEANLCPMDFVRLIWLDLKPFTYPAFVTSDAVFGLERLAHRWHLDPARVFAKLIDEWVSEMEPDNWWAADYSSGLLLPEENDDGVALIPPNVLKNHAFKQTQIFDVIVPPKTVETCRRLGTVHSFSAGDVLDYMVRRHCDELGIPLHRGRFTLI